MRKRCVLAAMAALIGGTSTASAQWREVETAHFRIVSESQPAKIEEFAARLESYDKLMRMATGIAEGESVKVRIYEVASTGEIERALGLDGSGVAGFYDNNALGPYAVTPRKTKDSGRYFTPALVLHHEYAHHFMLQYFPAIYPSWYTEGFAELIASSQPLDDGRIGYGMPAKHRGNEIAAYWVPLSELLTKEKVTNLDRYGQGWALTHFLTFDKTRAGRLRSYLTALANGQSYAEASKVFGDLSALNREARRYVTSGTFEYKPVKVDVTRPVIVRSRLLSQGEAALIGETIAFRDDELSLYRKAGARKREEGLRRSNLDRIRVKAAHYSNDPYALQLLAESEFAMGEFARSETAADRLLSMNPNHVRGLARKSLLLSTSASKLSGQARAAKAKQARQMAAKANRLDNDDPMPLLAFYQSFNLAGEKPSPVAIEGLIQVVSRLPRDNGTRQLLVDQMVRDKRFDEAIAWLRPIANSPHESPRRDAAREQLKQLEVAKTGKMAAR
ncbi:MAG: hypothetical protein H0W92_04955 [Sphingomonas sp.]|nr:hypothetical protein [Sphingomonas sp.]